MQLLPNRKFLTIIIGLTITVFAVSITIISPLLTNIAETYSITMAQSGILFTASFIGFVIFILIGGILSDYFGKKQIISISMGIFTLTLFLFPLSSGFTVSCIVIFFMGGIGGIIESMSNALIVDINPHKPAFYINISQLFFGVGAIAGPLAAAYIVYSRFPWQICYYIAGSLSFIVTLVFINIKIPEFKNKSRVDWSVLLKYIPDKRLLLACLAIFLYTGAEVGAWGWMATFLKKDMAFSIMKTGMALGVFWLVMTIGRLICASLSMRYSIRVLIIISSLLSSLITLLPFVISSETGLWLAITGMGLFYSGLWPLIVSYGNSLYRKTPAVVFSLMIGAGGLGAMIIPVLLGYIGEYVSIKLAMISPAVFIIMIVFIFLGVSEKRMGTVSIKE